MPNSEIARDAQVILRTLYSTQHGMRACGCMQEAFQGGLCAQIASTDAASAWAGWCLGLGTWSFSVSESFRFYTLLKNLNLIQNFEPWPRGGQWVFQEAV